MAISKAKCKSLMLAPARVVVLLAFDFIFGLGKRV
jgi:hypothetical protein